jgi:mycothiol synthase
LEILSSSAVQIRKFTISDLPRVAEIRNASLAISPDFYSMTVDRIRSTGMASELPLTSEILVAERDGAVRGYIHIYTDPHLLEGRGRINIDAFHVLPEERRTGLGAMLLEAAEAKAREWNGRYMSIAIPASVETSQTFLIKHQFQLMRYFWKLRHAELERLPASELPGNLRFRSFRRGMDEAAYVELLNATFAEHWDFAPVTQPELEAWNQRPDFDPRGCFFIVDGEREIAHITVLVDPQRAEETHDAAARVFELGVQPDYRGKGLGYQLLLKAAEFSRSQSLNALELVVDGQNDAAKGMYERMGFQEKRAILVFHKAL